MYRKNLDLAYAAAASTPGTANPLVTADESPWTHESGKVKVKTNFGANGVEVAVPSQTFVCDAEAEFDSPGVNVAWSTNKFTNTTSVVDRSSSNTYVANANYKILTAANFNTININTFMEPTASVGELTGASDFSVDLGAAYQIDRVTIGRANSGNHTWLAGSTSGTFSLGANILIYGSNGGLTGPWTQIWSGNGKAKPPAGAGSTAEYAIDAPGTYRYIRHVTDSVNNSSGCLVVGGNAYSSSNNTFATDDLVGGGAALTFDATKLVCKTLSSGGTTISGAGVVNVAYRTSSGGAYSTPVDLETFRNAATAPDLSNCSWLQLQFQLVGAQTMGYAEIQTYATAGLLTKAGNMTLSGDISLDDASLTGGLEVDDSITFGTRIIATAAGTTTGLATDTNVCFTGTTTQTYTLPACSAGREVRIKNRSTGAVTINRAGSDTIDGGATFTLNADDGFVFVGAGTDWMVF